MGKLQVKYDKLQRALATFCEAVESLNEAHQKHSSHKLILSLQDSLIKRFEYSIDGSWKYIKYYLEIELKSPPEYSSPKPIIRKACLAGLVSEEESSIFLDMFEKRNLTSHMYQEELAGIVIKNAQQYYDTMKKCIDRIPPLSE